MLRSIRLGMVGFFLALYSQPIVAQDVQWGGGASPKRAEFAVYAPTLLDISGKELGAGKQVYLGFGCKQKNGFVETKLRLRVSGDVGLNAEDSLRRSFLFLGRNADSDIPLSFIKAGPKYYELYDKAILTALLKKIAFSGQPQKLLLSRDRVLLLPPGNMALPGALNARQPLLSCFDGPGNTSAINYQFEEGYLAVAEQARSLSSSEPQKEKNCRAANVRLKECVSGVDMQAGGVTAIVCGGHQPGTFGSPASACSPISGFWCDVTTGKMYKSRTMGAAAICP